jgi:hypothetical protein
MSMVSSALASQSRHAALAALERATARGGWLTCRPAISVFSTGHTGHTVALRLAGRGVRTVVIDPSSGDDPARQCVSALLDTTVTLIGAVATTNLATRRTHPDPHGVIEAVGRALAQKANYHVIVVGSARSARTMTAIAAILEQASCKTLGPDFGLCCDETGWLETCHGGRPAPASLALASDRRAAGTVRAVYDLIGSSVDVRPLVLQRSQSC